MEEDGSGLLVKWFCGAAPYGQIILKATGKYNREMKQLMLRPDFRFAKTRDSSMIPEHERTRGGP